ncbi:MAG: hypothetical protein EXQ95_14435 [Alphaproteobacteria bacterium]|nr:hypothetical protein [Alphaproteobacteria bacterium]
MRSRIAMAMAMALALALLPAGADAQQKAAPPPKPGFHIVNETPARVYYRVKMWQGDFAFIGAGKELRVEIPESVGGVRSVQVEARSGEQWDNCYATVQVGAKLVVTQGKERINCRVDR